jgi:hypothetical protein
MRSFSRPNSSGSSTPESRRRPSLSRAASRASSSANVSGTGASVVARPESLAGRRARAAANRGLSAGARRVGRLGLGGP